MYNAECILPHISFPLEQSFPCENLAMVLCAALQHTASKLLISARAQQQASHPAQSALFLICEGMCALACKSCM